MQGRLFISKADALPCELSALEMSESVMSFAFEETVHFVMKGVFEMLGRIKSGGRGIEWQSERRSK